MIKLVEVSKVFYMGTARLRVLWDINVEIERGDITLITGPSGSGKTTLLNIIGGITRVTGGRVWIDDKEISGLPEHFLSGFRRDHIGVIFQDFNLLHGYTVYENMEIALMPSRVKLKERKEKIGLLLKWLNMTDRMHFDVNRLSGGEQQRVAIARAVINDPDIILADEPTSNVDESVVENVKEIIEGLIQNGKTIIIATHDKEFIANYKKVKTIVLKEGKIDQIL